MTFEQLSKILLKRWWLVVACFLLVGVGAFIGSSKLIKPLYQSSVVIEVVVRSGGDPLTNDNVRSSQQLAATEADIATKSQILSGVASRYPGLSVDELTKEVTAAPKDSTQLFEIDVLDPNPVRAANLANDIAATLIKQQLQATQQDDNRSLQQIQQELATLHGQINDTTNKIATLQTQPGTQPQINSLQTQLESLQQQYNQWQAELAQAELTATQNSNFLHVVQPAQPVFIPARPNKLIYIGAGLLIGLLLGILVAVIVELLDTRAGTKEVLTQLLNWPIMGTIWRTSRKDAIIQANNYSANADSYDILHMNIGFTTVDKPLHTLVITSTTPGEGKSTVATNLAICMAKTGKDILLIDANLRQPLLHEHFNIPADARGFSNAIMAFRATGNIHTPTARQSLTPTTDTDIWSPSTAHITNEPSLDAFMRAADTPNLCVMPSGPLPSNPAELLDSKAMQRFFAALSRCGAEVVIFDTPSLLNLPDASILASKADATLVVVDTTHIRKSDLKQAKMLLAQANAYVLGCVLNKQQRSRKNTPYSYYYKIRKQNSKNWHTPNRKDIKPSSISHVIPAQTTQSVASKTPKRGEIVSQPEQLDGEKKEIANGLASSTPPAELDDKKEQTATVPTVKRKGAGE